MPEAPKDRRSSQSGKPPTQMMHAVAELENWKLHVLFVVGIVGVVLVILWFVLDSGHEHTKLEMIAAGGIMLLCAFFAFPVGITRLLDKFWPAKWRHDRRTGQH